MTTDPKNISLTKFNKDHIQAKQHLTQTTFDPTISDPTTSI